MVPTKGNDDVPFRTRHHREWDRQVREIAGGLTIMKPAVGQWVDIEAEMGQKELHIERVIPVRIACTEQQIKKIMARTASHYKQLAVMAYKISDRVLIERYDQ